MQIKHIHNVIGRVNGAYNTHTVWPTNPAVVEIVPADALKEDVFLHFFSIILPSTQPAKGGSFRAVQLGLRARGR